jgi:hypothetical protein
MYGTKLTDDMTSCLYLSLKADDVIMARAVSKTSYYNSMDEALKGCEVGSEVKWKVSGE